MRKKSLGKVRTVSFFLTRTQFDIVERFRERMGKKNFAEATRGIIELSYSKSLKKDDIEQSILETLKSGQIEKIEKSIEETCHLILDGVRSLSSLYPYYEKMKRETNVDGEPSNN